MFGSQKSTSFGSGGRFDGAPVTKWLLILNIAIFFIDVVGAGTESWGRITPHALFSYGEHYYNAGVLLDTLSSFQLWRLIGFQFLHADVGHLLCNMLGIFMFGALVERVLGSLRFTIYYLLCGVGGALSFALLASIGWLDPGVLVGASAGLFGVLVALIIIAPNIMVRPMLMPDPISMKAFGMIILGVGVLTILMVGPNAGGEAGHIGGALVGFLLMKNPKVLSFLSGAFLPKPSRQKPVRGYVPKIRPRTTVRMNSSEVDRILDKVSEHGLHSLTDAERATLKNISEKD